MSAEKMVPEEWTSEAMEQIDDNWLHAARAGIYLALVTLHRRIDPELERHCLDYLLHYAEWEKMGSILQQEQLAYLLKRNYTPDGEDPDKHDAEWINYIDTIEYDWRFTP